MPYVAIVEEAVLSKRAYMYTCDIQQEVCVVNKWIYSQTVERLVFLQIIKNNFWQGLSLVPRLL